MRSSASWVFYKFTLEFCQSPEFPTGQNVDRIFPRLTDYMYNVLYMGRSAAIWRLILKQP